MRKALFIIQDFFEPISSFLMKYNHRTKKKTTSRELLIG